MSDQGDFYPNVTPSSPPRGIDAPPITSIDLGTNVFITYDTGDGGFVISTDGYLLLESAAT